MTSFATTRRAMTCGGLLSWWARGSGRRQGTHSAGSVRAPPRPRPSPRTWIEVGRPVSLRFGKASLYDIGPNWPCWLMHFAPFVHKRARRLSPCQTSAYVAYVRSYSAISANALAGLASRPLGAISHPGDAGLSSAGAPLNSIACPGCIGSMKHERQKQIVETSHCLHTFNL